MGDTILVDDHELAADDINAADTNVDHFRKIMDGVAKDGDILQFGSGVYYFNAPLLVYRPVTIAGTRAHAYADEPTELNFLGANTKGLIINSKTRVEDLKIYGAGGTTHRPFTDAGVDGLYCAANVNLINIQVRKFPDTGVFVTSRALGRTIAPVDQQTLIGRLSEDVNPNDNIHVFAKFDSERTPNGDPAQRNIEMGSVLRFYGFQHTGSQGQTSLHERGLAANIGSGVLRRAASAGVETPELYWRVVRDISKVNDTTIVVTLTGRYGDEGDRKPGYGLDVDYEVEIAGANTPLTGAIASKSTDPDEEDLVLTITLSPAVQGPITLGTDNEYWVVRDWNSAWNFALLTPLTLTSVAQPTATLTGIGTNWFTVAFNDRHKFAVDDIVTFSGVTSAGTYTITSAVLDDEHDPFFTFSVTTGGAVIAGEPFATGRTVSQVSGRRVIATLPSFTTQPLGAEISENCLVTLNNTDTNETLANGRVLDVIGTTYVIEIDETEDDIDEDLPSSGWTTLSVTAGAALTTANTDHYYLERVRVNECAVGIDVKGPRSNAGTAIHCDTTSCHQHGIVERSFFGNTWLMNHAEVVGFEEGTDPIGPTSMSWFTATHSHFASNGAQVGTSATDGVSSGTIELYNAGGLFRRQGEAIQVGDRIWFGAGFTRAVSPIVPAVANSDYDPVGESGADGLVVVWVEDATPPTRARVVPGNMWFWDPGGLGNETQPAERTGNVFRVNSAGSTPFPAEFIVGQYVDAGEFGSLTIPARIIARTDPPAPPPYTLTLDTGFAAAGATTGTLYVCSRPYADGSGPMWLGSAFYVPLMADSNVSCVFGQYTEDNCYPLAINNANVLSFQEVGGSRAYLRGGRPVVATAGARWSASHDGYNNHVSSTPGGSVGKTTFYGPLSGMCWGFGAENDPYNWQCVYRVFSSSGSNPPQGWYVLGHGADSTTRSGREIGLGFGGRFAVDVTTNAASAASRMWIPTLYLGKSVNTAGGGYPVFEISGTRRVAGAVTYHTLITHEVVGTRATAYATEGYTTGYRSRGISWGSAAPAAAPSTTPSASANQFNPGDVIFGTGLASGGPAAWVCSSSTTSTTPVFGQLWASVQTNLFMGTNDNAVTTVVIGNGSSNSAPANASIRGTNGTGNAAGASLSLAGGLGAGTGAGGSVKLQTAPAGSGAVIDRLAIDGAGLMKFRGAGVSTGQELQENTFAGTAAQGTGVTAWSLELSENQRILLEVSVIADTSANQPAVFKLVAGARRNGTGDVVLIGAQEPVKVLHEKSDGFDGSATITVNSHDVIVHITGATTGTTTYIGSVRYQML